MSDPFRLDGKRAVVTGAGKGIGRGISLQLARAGADLVISSRTQEDLDSLAIEIEALPDQDTRGSLGRSAGSES
jgi:7-alpha-hydroxysteroid dehydrogenase